MASDFTGGPGFLAFVVTFSLVVAGVLLFRSLSKHLRKVRAQAARDAAARDEAAGGRSPEAPGSADGEGGERGGDEVAGEAGDR
ncbi:hypothetical protein [Demequina phytophila]|uniref:hypothetical protein n=1 Tax=Demequina phytophila TaxID=1638981 RepID=UPI000784D88C|nr:hypothetical protein [Demequina phytophila]